MTDDTTVMSATSQMIEALAGLDGAQCYPKAPIPGVPDRSFEIDFAEERQGGRQAPPGPAPSKPERTKLPQAGGVGSRC